MEFPDDEFTQNERRFSILASRDTVTECSFWLYEWREGSWLPLPVYWLGLGHPAELRTRAFEAAQSWVRDRDEGKPWPPESLWANLYPRQGLPTRPINISR